MKRRIDGGRLLDLTDGSLTEVSVLVDDASGRVLAIGTDLPEADARIRLDGEVLLPGLIDVHVHLREPGFEDKETIATGTRAAAAGGFTQIACMPNTKPPIDTPEGVAYVRVRADEAGHCRVWPIACITEGQRGESLTHFAALKAAGAIALSDDGRGVQHGGLMLQALAEAAKAGLPMAIHAEDETLSGRGVFDRGAAERLGVPESPAEAESAMIARDLLLAERTGAHLHICHVSTESAVSLVRWAKARGVKVTAEVTPHHLLLSDDVIEEADPVYKVNPPLRSERDRLACLEGFLDGTLDMVATDHAPHTEDEKRRPLLDAPFGLVGIETVFPLLYTYLVGTGRMSLAELVKRMSTRPAQAFGLAGGVLRPGGPADLVAVDLEGERVIDPEQFYSKGRNTPFRGWRAAGFPTLTMYGGRVVHRIERGVPVGDR
ncbi:MAG: dihydroorotase [Alicyclobacillus macrosporangiidus]|uniref:dihydroorotase n=1 Tax=Alicyclobacillus macrosporangiidus TaxID=392015 RepID=UPI0026EA5638|nr:dihydroorotase [Alicyclobacillus macrosporangiidus]MCL6598329.1 dihydroorotase [Alicyclobacillus macrosporangiidus]